MRITVSIPVTAQLVSTIDVPPEALEVGIAGFLDDNPEYIEDIEANGQLEYEQHLYTDAQVVD